MQLRIVDDAHVQSALGQLFGSRDLRHGARNWGPVAKRKRRVSAEATGPTPPSRPALTAETGDLPLLLYQNRRRAVRVRSNFRQSLRDLSIAKCRPAHVGIERALMPRSPDSDLLLFQFHAIVVPLPARRFQVEHQVFHVEPQLAQRVLHQRQDASTTFGAFHDPLERDEHFVGMLRRKGVNRDNKPLQIGRQLFDFGRA